MNIRVRRAAKKDLPVITRFNMALAKETEGRALQRARLARGIKRLLIDPSKGFYLLAEVGGRVVGQLMLTVEWSDWRCGTFWWVQSVYVEKDFRRRGVFAELYRDVETAARNNRSVCGLRLYVEQSNRHAQKIYSRLGMKRTSYRLFETDFVLDTQSGRTTR